MGFKITFAPEDPEGLLEREKSRKKLRTRWVKALRYAKRLFRLFS